MTIASPFDQMHSLLGKLSPLKASHSYVIHAGRVLTGAMSGDRVLTDQAILVTDGTITELVDWGGYEVPEGVTVIDARDKTVMPGMIETHVHVTGEWVHDPHGTHLEPFAEARVLRGLLDAWAVLGGGFTSLFSMGHGHPNVVSGIKTMIDKEQFPGPRIYHCGWALSQTAGHGHVREWNYELVKALAPRSTFADGPWALRAIVRENVGNGADFIKLYAGEGGFTASPYIGRRLDFTNEEIQAITDEAHRLGFQVSSHCMTLEHVRHAVDNGVDRVEHGPVGYDDAFVPLLKERGASWCPTLSQLYWGLQEREKRNLSSSMVKKIEDGIIGRCRMIGEAMEAGVTVGFGTDNRMRPKAGQNAIELKIMQDHGIAPLDIVAIATSQAAKLVGLDEHLGLVASGKRADLLVVDGNPAEDVSVLVDSSNIAQILMAPGRLTPRAMGGERHA
jgi:imidazolonepropionase-like amidohydrolase